MPPEHEEVRAEMQKVEEGAPIPPLEISIAKEMWEASLVALRGVTVVPVETHTANAAGTSSLNSKQFVSQFWRGNLLTSLIGRGVLREFLQDEQSVQKLIIAAATFPCKRDDVGEAMILFRLTQVAREEARKTKAAMKQEGFDPDNLNIDSRFIQWMKDNC